jgi:hypothetical protein
MIKKGETSCAISVEDLKPIWIRKFLKLQQQRYFPSELFKKY